MECPHLTSIDFQVGQNRFEGGPLYFHLEDAHELELDFRLREGFRPHSVVFEVHPEEHPPVGVESEYVQGPGQGTQKPEMLHPVFGVDACLHDLVHPYVLVICEQNKITRENIQGVPDVVGEVLSVAGFPLTL